MHTQEKISNHHRYYILTKYVGTVIKNYLHLTWKIGKLVLAFHYFVIKVIMTTMKVGGKYTNFFSSE